jgi:hypothetical protein
LSVSLKMDTIEYRAVIKFFVKEGLTPNEIHSKFIKVYEDSSPSFSTNKKWAAEFKRGQFLLEKLTVHYIPYCSIDNAHLMYNAHSKLFRHSFRCIDNAHDAN